MRRLRGKIRIYLMTASMCFSLPAFAAEEWDFSSPHKTRCSVGTMLEMNKCLENELQGVEARLRTVYESYLRTLKSPSSLKRAQAEWARFRKLECDFSISGIAKDGSLYSYSYSACMIDLDERRIRDLQRYRMFEGVGAPPRRE